MQLFSLSSHEYAAPIKTPARGTKVRVKVVAMEIGLDSKEEYQRVQHDHSSLDNTAYKTRSQQLIG